MNFFTDFDQDEEEEAANNNNYGDDFNDTFLSDVEAPQIVVEIDANGRVKLPDLDEMLQGR